MQIEELQHSLEAHEMTINKWRSHQEQVLHVHSNYKGKEPWKGNKSNTTTKNQEQVIVEGSESSKGKTTCQTSQKSNSNNNKEWKLDKRKVKCYNCQKLGHYAKEFWQGEGAKNKLNNHANLAQDEGSDSELVLLMATISSESSSDFSWYLDSGCSTHMTRKRDWFINMNESSKSWVCFADHITLIAEGIEKVAFRRRMEKTLSLRRCCLYLAWRLIC